MKDPMEILILLMIGFVLITLVFAGLHFASEKVKESTRVEQQKERNILAQCLSKTEDKQWCIDVFVK